MAGLNSQGNRDDRNSQGINPLDVIGNAIGSLVFGQGSQNVHQQPQDDYYEKLRREEADRKATEQSNQSSWW